jgi:hypothetical protein
MVQKRKGGAKSKYTLERVDLICHMIASTGQDKAGYEAAKIGSSTFHDWLNDKPEFSERVSQARAAWREIDDEAMIEAFRQGLIKAMVGYQQVRTNEETTTLPNGDEVTKESRSTATVPPAEWAFRIVAPQMQGKFGVDRKDITTDGKAIDWGNLTREQLARIAAGESPNDVLS